MGLSDLQSHIFQSIPDATASVDLLRVAKERSKRESPLKLVVDGECCLDRLYGGYYPDWVCGGQWDKMEQFLQNFSRVIHNSNLDLVIFFNGTPEHERIGGETVRSYEETYRCLEEITKHVALKKKPPPKVWWIPPAYLRSAIRQTLRIFDIKVMCTLDDHHRDVLRFSQRNRFHGIVADNPEYLIFDSFRYFSAKKLKLTFKGSLETVEVKLKKAYETLNVPKERIFIFCALLGNHFLTEGDLSRFYASLDIQNSQSKAAVIEKVAQFVRELETKDPEKVASAVAAKSFESDSEEDKEKSQVLANKVNTCLQHFQEAKSLPSAAKAKAKKAKKQKTPVSKAQTGPDSDKRDEVAKAPTTNGEEAGVQENIAAVNGSPKSGKDKKEESVIAKMLYRISPKVEEVATGRHRAGVMSPYICQIIKNREIRLPLIVEDIRPGKTDTPRAHEIFRPLRQRVYAILFNQHHLNFLAKQKNEKVPPIQVRETFFCTRTKQVKTQTVTAVGFPIPTVEKLWLGEGDECKNKRIRAFLTIMNSDNRLMTDQDYVPQQMVVLAMVLRYILHSDKKLIRQHELEAFVAQAFIQDMTDPNMAQDIEVSNLTMRGIHLSHVFMEGVEMALLANDACGAPIPYMLFCPWLFFNGKIFNYVLEQQAEGKTLTDICGYKADLLYSIDQLTIAICEGIKSPFAPDPASQLFLPAKNLTGGVINPLLPHGPQGRLPYNAHQQSPSLYGSGYGNGGNPLLPQYSGTTYIPRNRPYYGGPGNGPVHPNFGGSLMGGGGAVGGQGGYYSGQAGRGFVPQGLYALYNNSDSGRQRRVQDRGGQLEVGGVVVGSWGANYGPSAHGGNSGFGQGSRINRNSLLGPGSQHPRITPLMHPRISGLNANKMANGRSGPPANHWAQKRGSRVTKKSIMKKPGAGEGKTKGNSGGAQAASSGSSGNGNRAKGVTFKDVESKKSENGNGDTAAVLESQQGPKSTEVAESSPPVEPTTSDTCPQTVVEGV